MKCNINIRISSISTENSELKSISFLYYKKPNKRKLQSNLNTFIKKIKSKFDPRFYIIYRYADYTENCYGVYFSCDINDKHINHKLYNEPDISFDINNREVTYIPTPQKYCV